MINMNEKKFDDLVCGNCGYDGGRTSLLKISELEKKLIQAKQRSDSSIESTHFAFTLFLIDFVNYFYILIIFHFYQVNKLK